MGNGIAKLTALVDGTRSLRSTVARNAAGEGELLEHFLHAFLVLTDVRIYLTVASVQIGVSDQKVSAVARAGKKDHIQIISFDGTVAVYIYEILSRHGSPVSDDFLFDLIHAQRFL